MSKMALRGNVVGVAVALSSVTNAVYHIGSAQVRNLGLPNDTNGLQKDVGAADVTMNNGMWFSQVKVVERPSTIHGN